MYYPYGYGYPYRRYGYPYSYGYLPYGYPRYSSTNLLNSQIASVNQSFFNAGIATGVYQTANNFNYAGLGYPW